MSAALRLEAFRTEDRPPPNGVAVLVCGGIAVRKTGGEWFTGMEEPLYQRALEWTPEWWAFIPQNIEMPLPQPPEDSA